MIFHLLSFWRWRSKKGTACKHQILSLQIKILIYQKILLLWSYRSCNFGCFFVAKQFDNPKCLLTECLHGTKKRRLFVKRLSCVGAKCCRNTQDHATARFFQKGRRCNIPCSIPSRLKCGTQPSGRKRRSIWLSFDKLFSRKLHQHSPLCVRMRHKGIVFFGRNTRKRLKPMCIMCCAVLYCPILHGLCHNVSS